MDKAKRKAIIAGNWKMNKTASEAAVLQGANLAEAQSFMDYLLSERSKDLLASKGYPLLWRVSDYAHDDGRKMMIGDLLLAVDDLSWTAGQKSVIIQQWLNAQ